MESRPTVSVLMGVYNETEHIRTAINSILSQSLGDFELIIVDDGSTDDTVEIIESYDDDRIHLLCNETNVGLTVSLNRALKAASGRYVARQDADDISESDRFERQVKFLEEHDEITLVGTDATLIDADGRTRDYRRVFCRPDFDSLLEKNDIIHGSVMIKRDVLADIGGYNEFFRYGQDYELWLRLAKQYKIANISAPLYRLRIHNRSVYFSQKDESALYEILARDIATGRVDRSILDELNEITGYYTQLSDSQRARFHRDLATRYIRYGHLNPGQTELKKARTYGEITPTLILLELLSRTGPRTIQSVRWGIRRLINARIWIRNRRQCPDQV